MNIGDVASASGLPAKTIRYYEDIGLVRPARSENGYRHFRETDIHKLAFLGRARSLGFTIDECRTLMSLYEDRDRASADDPETSRYQLPRRLPSRVPNPGRSRGSERRKGRLISDCSSVTYQFLTLRELSGE